MEAGRDGARRRCREYLVALEEERRKIQVFQRELPLCFDLVTQTIEGMRSQMDGAGSEETVSDQGPPPVLEEFIPLKPSLSLSSSSEDEESTHAAAAKKEEEAAETSERHSPPQPEASKKVTPDWLQSVQLWSQEPHPSSPTPTPLAKDVPCKPVALNARKGGGAFHPFGKEKQRAAELPASSTTAAAAASSTAVGDSGGDKATTDDDTENHRDETTDKDAKDKEGQSQSTQANRKPRRCWAPELHRRFLQALQQLGGSHVATPKQIRELMKVDGLTNDEVKSHLQKYRLHTRRPSSTGHSSAGAGAAVVTPTAPQFVVVGSIWVPPPEYAAAAAAQHAAAAGDASGSANPVYAPVAMLPSGLQPHSHRKQQQQGQRSHGSEGRRSGDAGDGSSSSPAVSSSSTQTTSA